MKGNAMMEYSYTDRQGNLKTEREIFNAPADPDALRSRLNERYQAALAKVFAEGGNMHGITQRRIGRNDPCPCGSGRKFKKCCERKMNTALAGIPATPQGATDVE